jgi:hypothetical protein
VTDSSHEYVVHDRCCHDSEGHPRKGMISRWRAKSGSCCHQHVVDEGIRTTVEEKTAQIDERLDVLEKKLLILAPEEVSGRESA